MWEKGSPKWKHGMPSKFKDQKTTLDLLDKCQGIFRNFACESKNTNLHLLICMYILAIQSESTSQHRKQTKVKSVCLSIYMVFSGLPSNTVPLDLVVLKTILSSTVVPISHCCSLSFVLLTSLCKKTMGVSPCYPESL